MFLHASMFQALLHSSSCQILRCPCCVYTVYSYHNLMIRDGLWGLGCASKPEFCHPKDRMRVRPFLSWAGEAELKRNISGLKSIRWSGLLLLMLVGGQGNCNDVSNPEWWQLPTCQLFLQQNSGNIQVTSGKDSLCVAVILPHCPHAMVVSCQTNLPRFWIIMNLLHSLQGYHSRICRVFRSCASLQLPNPSANKLFSLPKL